MRILALAGLLAIFSTAPAQEGGCTGPKIDINSLERTRFPDEHAWAYVAKEYDSLLIDYHFHYECVPKKVYKVLLKRSDDTLYYYDGDTIPLRLHFPAKAGTYHAWTETSFGRKTLDFEIRLAVTTALETNPLEELRFVTNPLDGVLAVHNISSASTLSLTDLSGRCVQEVTLEGRQPVENVDISGLQSGIYIIRVASVQGMIVKKVAVDY